MGKAHKTNAAMQLITSRASLFPIDSSSSARHSAFKLIPVLRRQALFAKARYVQRGVIQYEQRLQHTPQPGHCSRQESDKSWWRTPIGHQEIPPQRTDRGK